MHIGLIGGIGPAATEHYYRGLVAAHADAGLEMDLTIVQASARTLVRNVLAEARQAQTKAFLPLVQRLQAAGAEAVAVTSLGGHFCFNELEALSPLPLINLVRALDADIAARGLKRVGLLGTGLVMRTKIYGGIPSVEAVAPQGADLDAVHEDYIAMALSGHVTDAQRERMFAAGVALCRDQGAEAVILAGTDLFLAFDGHDPGFPIIDSAAVHIDAIYRAATTIRE